MNIKVLFSTVLFFLGLIVSIDTLFNHGYLFGIHHQEIGNPTKAQQWASWAILILFVFFILNAIAGWVSSKKVGYKLHLITLLLIALQAVDSPSLFIYLFFDGFFGFAVLLLLAAFMGKAISSNIKPEEYSDEQRKVLMWMGGFWSPLLTTPVSASVFGLLAKGMPKALQYAMMAMCCNMLGLILIGDAPFIIAMQKMGILPGMMFQFKLMIVTWLFSVVFYARLLGLKVGTIWKHRQLFLILSHSLSFRLKKVFDRPSQHDTKKVLESDLLLGRFLAFEMRFDEGVAEIVRVVSYQVLSVVGFGYAITDIFSTLNGDAPIIVFNLFFTENADNMAAALAVWGMNAAIALGISMIGGAGFKFGNGANMVFWGKVDQDPPLLETLICGNAIALPVAVFFLLTAVYGQLLTGISFGILVLIFVPLIRRFVENHSK